MGQFFNKYCFALMLLLLVNKASHAQEPDTLTLGLPELQSRFVQANYRLIAARYQIEEAKAEVITARLFDNPELSYENILYNPETKRFLSTSAANGQYQAALSQLIKLAGKRNKNIQLATTGTKMAEYQYYDLMRTLRFELNSSFYKAYYLQQSAAVYNQQVNSLKLLLNASQQQLAAGNIANKDLVRIKSLLYSLQGEYNTLLNDLDDARSQLKMLTNLPASASLKLTAVQNDSFSIEAQQYTTLLDSARKNRADLMLSKTNLQYATQNLSLQKANAVPDLELSLSYDLQGSYIRHYNGIGVKIPLPLFNRNQGEIKKAKVALEASDNALKSQEAILENEVSNSFNTAVRTERLYESFDKDFPRDFSQLIAQVIKNFKSRNISLIEFLDFYDAYKSSTLQMNAILFDRMNAKEELNFVTGSTIFK